jgi:hypothetical protein
VAADTTLEEFCKLTGVAPGENNPPVADDQTVTTGEDKSVDINLTASDDDGDTLTYAALSQPGHGSLSGTPPDLTYTPEEGYTGRDSFTFIVNDGKAYSNIATVNIMVTSAPGGCDNLEGTWYHDTPGSGCSSTWYLSRTDNGNYNAEETGCGNASGTAKLLTGNRLRIDWYISEACKGYYYWDLDTDCSSGEGELVWTSNVDPCKGILKSRGWHQQ